MANDNNFAIKEDVKEKHKIVIDLPEEFKYEKRSVFEVDCFYNPAWNCGITFFGL